jgi:dTMP kinase
VVSDRFSGSTLAYQGYGRGLPVAELATLVSWAAAGVAPDLSVLVDVDVELASARLRSGDRAAGGRDRLERLGPDFAGRVRAGFLAQAAEDPEHWVVVDGADHRDVLAARIVAVVRARLGDPPASAR